MLLQAQLMEEQKLCCYWLDERARESELWLLLLLLLSVLCSAEKRER